MTLQQARKELSWMCGCGMPEAAVALLRDVLALHPLYDHQDEVNALLPSHGIEYFVLYMLDHLDLTEHGGTVGGGWLTDKGEAFLTVLQTHDPAVVSESCCMHGYSIEHDSTEDCAECK